MNKEHRPFILANIFFAIWASASGALLGYSIDIGSCMTLMIPSGCSLAAAGVGWVVYLICHIEEQY